MVCEKEIQHHLSKDVPLEVIEIARDVTISKLRDRKLKDGIGIKKIYSVERQVWL